MKVLCPGSGAEVASVVTGPTSVSTYTGECPVCRQLVPTATAERTSNRLVAHGVHGSTLFGHLAGDGLNQERADARVAMDFVRLMFRPGGRCRMEVENMDGTAVIAVDAGSCTASPELRDLVQRLWEDEAEAARPEGPRP